ncbi:MAG: SUMF1/EgtB/PvdO family nonheme iron enzyme [Candidatus Delongbacteria bacterium]|nr:SUMF1/EgtB/PvdO family nonheme iron enzyme [Candidatus Delongbacteria bacterium]
MKILLFQFIVAAVLFAAEVQEPLITDGVPDFNDIKVRISSDPESLRVYFDYEDMGLTPLEFICSAGRYRVEIECENHKSIDEVLVVRPPGTEVNYVLEDLRASLTVETFNKASIFVNGEQVKNRTLLKIPPQEVEIRIEMDGAKPFIKNAVLTEKGNRLFMMYPEIPTGMISFNVEPASACIELWEEGVEKYCSSGSKSFQKLPEGIYNYKVFTKGYKTETGIVEVQAGKALNRKVSLERGAEIGGQYVHVKGGSFRMGNNGSFDGSPVRNVHVNDYSIGRYEVTQAEWDFVMDSNGCCFSGDSLPVENVSWIQAVEFCNRLSEIEGLQQCYRISDDDITCNFNANGYRLPTEAEWEYAAKGGKQSSVSKSGVSGRCLCDGPVNVGCTAPNGLGIYDMSGNVYEWCWDWYGLYPDSSESDPSGPENGRLRVARGGSWLSSEKNCEVNFRNMFEPAHNYSFVGFRIVKRK